jgi:hypothetical protein
MYGLTDKVGIMLESWRPHSSQKRCVANEMTHWGNDILCMVAKNKWEPQWRWMVHITVCGLRFMYTCKGSLHVFMQWLMRSSNEQNNDFFQWVIYRPSTLSNTTAPHPSKILLQINITLPCKILNFWSHMKLIIGGLNRRVGHHMCMRNSYEQHNSKIPLSNSKLNLCQPYQVSQCTRFASN